MSKKHASRPFWINHQQAMLNSRRKTCTPYIKTPEIQLSNNIDITDKTIAFVAPRLDCTVEKCVKEYTHLFEMDNYQIIFTPQARMQEVIQYVPKVVVLFRVGTNDEFINEIGLANVVKLITHLRSLGVRVVYYIDDLLIHKNNRAPISIASQCDAIIVATTELYDIFNNISTIQVPIHIVLTHVYLDRFDELPPIKHIKAIPRFKVLMTSSGRLGAVWLHDICAKADQQWENFDNIEWIINAAGVAEMRTLINCFRNLHKTYIDWLPLDAFYSLCKSVDLMIYPAIPQDLNLFVPESWQKSWLDAKSAVKYTMAGAAGIPLISTPTRSYKEAIRDGETGILANSVDEFLEKIKFFETHPQEARKIGLAARKDIEENFDIKKRFPLYRDCIIGSPEVMPTIQKRKKSYLVGPTSDEKPIASIIVLSYNQEMYVAEAIESATNQNFDLPFEVIVVDDGSTDKSVEIANKFNNIRVIALPQNTKSWAAEPLNQAVAIARGEYIGHVASDDILHENYLSATVPMFESNPAVGIVSIGMREIAEGCVPAFRYPALIDPIKYKREILEWNFIFGSSPHTKKAWEAVGGYRPFYLQDWDLWIRIIWENFNVIPCNQILYTYRIHTQSMSNLAREGKLNKDTQDSLMAMAVSHADKITAMGVNRGELYAVLATQNRN